MWNDTTLRIEQIHRMLESGHKSVRLERHTLLIWGLTAAGLILLVNNLVTAERFPIHSMRILIANIIITVSAVTAAYWDFRLTRLRREARDETLSYLQVQLTKVWWSIIAMIILINLGMNIFGGGYLFYPILIALTGLGFYIHGLFSQQLLAWCGLLIILTGLASIALSLPIDTLEWLAVFLFGLGLPVMAWLIDHPGTQRDVYKRLLTSLAWLCLIALPTWSIHHYHNQPPAAEASRITLQDYLQRRPASGQADYVVKLPAGTAIPVFVHPVGNTPNSTKSFNLPLTLNKSLELVVSDGVAEGYYRVDAGAWVRSQQRYRVKDHRLVAEIGAQQQGITTSLDFVMMLLTKGI